MTDVEASEGKPLPEMEIEITPEMIEAGAREYSASTSDFFDPEDVAAAVYRVMERARRLST